VKRSIWMLFGVFCFVIFFFLLFDFFFCFLANGLCSKTKKEKLEGLSTVGAGGNFDNKACIFVESIKTS
jgi:hypothetical protein